MVETSNAYMENYTLKPGRRWDDNLSCIVGIYDTNIVGG
jgi:hypothetical protein